MIARELPVTNQQKTKHTKGYPMSTAHDHVTKLSPSQRKLYAVGIAVAVGVIALGYALTRNIRTPMESKYTIEQSIGQIASGLEVTGQSLAKELNLPMDAPRKEPLQSLGITQDKLDVAAGHLKSHEPSNLTYFVYIAIVAFGLLYLVRLGRPDGSPVVERNHWYNRTPYIVALTVAVVLSGFVLGKSPNPMESFVKVFKAMVGLYPSVWVQLLWFAFFIVLVIVGNKLVCGWGCPFGAIQELIYSVPVLRKLKKKKLPFLFTNTVRVLLFLVSLGLLFGIIDKQRGFVAYHLVNPFNMFDLKFETTSIALVVIITLLISVVSYRPFCHIICPFGLVSWIAEKFSMAKVRINRAKCTSCGSCARACPSEAALGILQQKKLPSDCFSCGRCLNVCPEDAIKYSFKEEKQ